MENPQEYFKNWSQKLTIPVEEIEKEFNTILNEEKKVNPSLSIDEQSTRALTRLSLIYKKQLRSPAIGFEGVVFGAEDARDLNSKMRRLALEAFRRDPQLAISQGVCDEEGTPLDSRAVFSTGRENVGFGKPLGESWIRKVYGICFKQGGQFKYFELSLNGEVSKKEVPVMVPVRFRAIDKSEDESMFKLNGSSYTTFETVETTVDIEQLLRNYMTVLKISDLQRYHDLNKEDPNRIVAIEGDVSILSLEPTAFGSRIMQVEDLSNFDLDAKGLTCWIPQEIKINFPEGSKVIVVGRTSQGKLKDELGNPTDTLGDITMNVFGVYAINPNVVPNVNPIDEI